MAKNNSYAISQIFEINGILEKLPREFNDAKNALTENNYEKYASKFIEATLKLEKATLKARGVANITFKQNNQPLEYKKFVNKLADEVQKITVNVDKNITKITLPGTLPHYKNNFKSILLEPLNFKMKNYQKCNGKFPDYSEAVFVIVNVVNENKNKKFIRDNDNYDYKQIVNSIAYWLLNDDGYDCCSMFNMSKIGEEDRTEIYVVPKSEFIGWCEANLHSI